MRASDLAAVKYSKVGAEGGGGLFLDLKNGERLDISGVVHRVAMFMEWASSNYPDIEISTE